MLTRTAEPKTRSRNSRRSRNGASLRVIRMTASTPQTTAMTIAAPVTVSALPVSSPMSVRASNPAASATLKRIAPITSSERLPWGTSQSADAAQTYTAARSARGAVT